jgi:predicted exporter
VLIAVALRSPRRMLRVMAPLAGTVLLVMAGLALAGQKLTILHLVGLLLVIAVGSNYALFFSQPQQDAISRSTLTSLLFANMTTVAGFGILAFSSVPVLNAIGMTVGPGAVLALLLAAVFGAPASRRVSP